MMKSLSFKKFLTEDEVSIFAASDQELNTQGQIPVQVFGWVGPFSDGVYRFGQAFEVIKRDDNDSDDDTIWIKPVTGKERGDREENNPGPAKLNVMKCARKHPSTGQMMQVECPILKDTKSFPIKKEKWTQLVNKPFQQMQTGGMGAAGGLPGMM